MSSSNWALHSEFLQKCTHTHTHTYHIIIKPWSLIKYFPFLILCDLLLVKYMQVKSIFPASPHTYKSCYMNILNSVNKDYRKRACFTMHPLPKTLCENHYIYVKIWTLCLVDISFWDIVKKYLWKVYDKCHQIVHKSRISCEIHLIINYL